jgi:hypothetical protein
VADTLLTAAEYQQMILDELGASNTSALARQVPLMWRRHRARGSVSRELQYLFVKEAAIRFLMSQPDEREKHYTAYGGGIEVFNQDWDHLEKLLEGVISERVALQKVLRGDRDANTDHRDERP